MAVDALSGPLGRSLGPFHVHFGHPFEGFRIVERRGRMLLEARCECGAVLDVADAVFAACPDCGGAVRRCSRCGGTGAVVDHAALRWRLPDDDEEDDGRAG